MLNYAKLPNPNLAGSFKYYIEHGIEPGGFLTAVLSNDLKEACGRADHINQHVLWEIVAWCFNELPHNAWGSAEKYRNWIIAKRLKAETATKEGNKP